MSRIDQLIATLCPDGVECYDLGDIALIDGNGVDKKINENHQKVTLLNYMDIYRNRFIDESVLTMEVTATKRQVIECNIQEGDIFITPTSETMEDLAHSAVAIYTIDGAVYSYHVKRIRLKKKCMITSYYLNYLFRSSVLQNQILRKATGLTRFGLSSGNWSALRIPFPPYQVQEEIVRILDTFTNVVEELETELDARVRQYEYYRNYLLEDYDRFVGSIDTGSTFHHSLDEVCLPVDKIRWNENKGITFRYIDLASTDRTTKKIQDTLTINSKNAPSRAQQIVRSNDVIFGATRPTLKRYAFITDEFDRQICSTGFCVLRPDEKKILPKYLYYHICSTGFEEHVERYQKGSAYPAITDKDVKSFEIPILPIEEQKRIVSILDRFDTLVHDLKSGLPAEISARRKQYEYYRDKLLTFPPLK